MWLSKMEGPEMHCLVDSKTLFPPKDSLSPLRENFKEDRQMSRKLRDKIKRRLFDCITLFRSSETFYSHPHMLM